MYLSTLIMTRVSTDTFTDKLDTKGQNWGEVTAGLRVVAIDIQIR